MNDSKREPAKVTVYLTGPGAQFVIGTALATPPSRISLWAVTNGTGRGVEWTAR